MVVRRSENISVGEEGSKQLYYATIFRPSELDDDNHVYSFEVAEQALSKFIQDNPNYEISENGHLVSIIDSYEVINGQLVLKSLVKTNTINGQILHKLVTKTNINMVWKVKAEYVEDSETKNIITEIKINAISIGNGTRK